MSRVSGRLAEEQTDGKSEVFLPAARKVSLQGRDGCCGRAPPAGPTRGRQHLKVLKMLHASGTRC